MRDFAVAISVALIRSLVVKGPRAVNLYVHIQSHMCREFFHQLSSKEVQVVHSTP